MKNKSVDLTQGSITRAMLLFALPLLGTSIIQQMYNTVDLMFVGNLLGQDASAAVGTCSWPINCFVGFFTGMGVGIGVLVSQAYGGKDFPRLKKILHTAMGFSVIGSAVLLLIGWIFAPAILRLMNTPDEILNLAVMYARIYFLSMFSIVGFNFSSGILRALGDSRRPMIYQLLGGFANILGNTLFIYIFHFGVAGAAMATVFVPDRCRCPDHSPFVSFAEGVSSVSPRNPHRTAHTQTDFCNRCAGRRSDNRCVSVLGFAPIANQHHGRHQHGCLYLLR